MLVKPFEHLYERASIYQLTTREETPENAEAHHDSQVLCHKPNGKDHDTGHEVEGDHDV